MTLVACLTGCNSDETTEAKPALELVMVGGKEIVIPASEPGTSVAINADCHWEITDVDNSQWDDLTVSPRSGDGNGTIVFTSKKNKPSPSPRREDCIRWWPCARQGAMPT